RMWVERLGELIQSTSTREREDSPNDRSESLLTIRGNLIQSCADVNGLGCRPQKPGPAVQSHSQDLPLPVWPTPRWASTLAPISAKVVLLPIRLGVSPGPKVRIGMCSRV